MNVPSASTSTSAPRLATRALAALTAVLLLAVLLPGATASAAALVVQIAPERGGGAVQEGGAVSVTGTAPDGGRVEDGFVLAIGEDGQVVDRRQLSVAARNGAPPQATYVRVDGDKLTGRFVLDCVFASDTSRCPQATAPVRGVVLEVTVSGETARSNELPLDNVDPLIVRHEVVAPRAVRVVFNETVTEPGGDSPLDFRVRLDGQDYAVTAVRAGTGPCAAAGPDRVTPASGCTRDLELGRALPEDAVPEVLYAPALTRNGYTDGAGNVIDRGSSLAAPVVDRVRPAVPRIDSVGGSAPTGTPPTASANQRQPQVVVSGLTVGHEVRVLVARDGQTLDSGYQPVTSSTQSVQAPLPTGEQEPVLVTAQARDRELNDSSETTKQPARADQAPNPVVYVLDTVVPQLRSARAGRTEDVTVVFSEPVSGSDNPGDFTITTPQGQQLVVLAVVASPDRRSRTLDTLQPVPPGSVVTYRPAPGSTRYRDDAGNALPDGFVVLGSVDVPVLVDPVAPVLTRAPSYTVRGTAPAGTTVLLYADQGDDGTPDGAPLQTQALEAGQTAFAFSVPLVRNGATDLVVTARDRTQELESRPAPVARITQDDVAPTLTLTSPQGGEVYAGGSEQEVRFTYQDANPGAVRVEILLAGQTLLLSPGAAPGTAFRYRVPLLSDDAARIRVTPRDAAGNEAAPVLSASFVVDALPPTLLPVTIDARTVDVRFSEPGVTGSSTLLDWRIEDEQVSSAEQRTEGDRIVVRLRTGATTFGPDAMPRVRYEPSAVSQEYRDRAQQPVPVRFREVRARDGIRPVAPTVTVPGTPVVTRGTTQRVSGDGRTPDSVELLDPTGVRVAGPTPVRNDSTWSVDVTLAPDSTSDLRAQSVDVNGNRSAATTPVARIDQDSTDPVVTVLEPVGGSRFAPGQRVTVRWTSRDRNLQDGRTTVQTSTDGGTTFATLAEGQPANGSVTWTLPSTTTDRALVRVSTTDRAERTGSGSSGLVGVGVAPATSGGPGAPGGGGGGGGGGAGATPSGSATSFPGATASPGTTPSAGTTPSDDGSPTAAPVPTATTTATGSASPSTAPTAPLPPLPPLGLSTGPGSIIPGQLAPVTVTGRPGTRVELRAYSRPSTTYVPVRTGVLDSTGRTAFAVRPGANTRLFARAVDGSRQGDSRSAVVSVRTALSLTVVRNGRRDYVFQGRILPRRSGQLITLYRVERDGRRVITAQLRTDATGTYRLRRLFTGSGRFGFLTRTGTTLTNAAGESNEGRARPTDVF